jgi:hypothetical protein
LPEPSEKAPRPPAQAVDPLAKFGPQKEISHIFRVPEKRPPKEVSLAFAGVTLLPFIGFLVGVSPQFLFLVYLYLHKVAENILVQYIYVNMCFWLLLAAYASGSQLEELPIPARTSCIRITLPCWNWSSSAALCSLLG